MKSPEFKATISNDDANATTHTATSSSERVASGSASGTAAPPTLYAQETGVPYVLHHLGITSNTVGEYGDLSNEVDDIQDYFKEQVERGKYANDGVGFKEFMKHLERVTDTKSMPISTKLGLISEFIKYQERSKKWVR